MSKDDITLNEALEDVEVRFLYNLPPSELEQVDRLFFQIEQAHWFYEDFYSDKYSHLPHFKFKGFVTALFNHCPLLQPIQEKAQILFDDFNAYRGQIPVYGCILLDENMKKMVLVRNWSGNSWGFPKGKVNQDEDPFACAMREVFEETGFHPNPYCKEDNVLAVHEDNRVTKLYIAVGVPSNTEFNPQTRKEISKVEFHAIDSPPQRCYGVFAFLPKLRNWIKQYQRKRSRSIGFKHVSVPNTPKGLRGSGSADKRCQTNNLDVNLSSVFNNRNVDTFGETGATTGKAASWGVSAMFAANSKLTGRTYEYDGNPHNFGSTHPRYVDYNSERASIDDALFPPSTKATSASTSASVERYVTSFNDANIKFGAVSIFTDKLVSHSPQPIRLNAAVEPPSLSLTGANVKTRSCSVSAITAEQRRAFDNEKSAKIAESRKRFQMSKSSRRSLASTKGAALTSTLRHNTLTRPFVFDQLEIMQALDQALANTNDVYNDLFATD